VFLISRTDEIIAWRCFLSARYHGFAYERRLSFAAEGGRIREESMSKKRPQPVSANAAARIEECRKLGSPRLTLDGCGLQELPETIFTLATVQHLNLDDNWLTSIPEQLWDLPALKTISLLGNPIEVLPDRPGLILDASTYTSHCDRVQPKNVTTLFVPENCAPHVIDRMLVLARNWIGLADITIGDWMLYIGRTRSWPQPQIRKLLTLLYQFDFLEALSIRGLRLQSLPNAIRRLRKLRILDISGSDLTSLPPWLSELPLKEIHASDNLLNDIPASFRKLISLKRLDLAWNPLGTIPSVIFDLASLEHLDLREAEIKEIPEQILKLKKLSSAIFFGNATDAPPPEVTDKGLDAIRDYWRQRADTGVDYLCEAKLIILGEPGAGKTTLAKKISNPEYKLRQDEESTEGIDVLRYRFPTAIRAIDQGKESLINREFQANIWDFGGQEIYHATHQFFLTRRSLYLLVCDDRKEDTDFSYWLHVVEMLTDGSPLLIIQNEKQGRTREINLSSLRARFPNLQGSWSTNLATNEGLERTVTAIRKQLEDLPHVGAGLPATWKRVREALERDPRDYVSRETYLDICQRHGFTRQEDKLQLSGYLHDLGICLHFQDDPLLKNTVILKPSWGTDAVYRVLDDPQVIANRGQFTQQDLMRIWSEPKYAGMQDELLHLMMKFQLCYSLEAKRSYIAPQLLSFDQPAYAWNESDQLVVRYEYVFMPKGILTRFIVATHHLIADAGRLVWRNGVVLERDGCRAEVIEEYALRRIRVRISGGSPRGLLAIIDDQLERLHALFPRLQYDRFLPCPCPECRDSAEPYGLALQHLKRRAAKRQPIQCHSSGEMVDAAAVVRDLLPHTLNEHERVLPAKTQDAPAQQPVSPEVFVSYAWSEESRALVDQLQEALHRKGVRLLRDREEIRYKDSIRNFMRRMGRGKHVIAVISEKYLKSENCMFELLQVAQARDFRDRIYPIILPDAGIYAATGRIRYVRFWEEQGRILDEALKTVRGDNLVKLQEDLNLYAEIRRLFDDISGTLRDMNALTASEHEQSGFEEIIRRIGSS
jgi:internalin A